MGGDLGEIVFAAVHCPGGDIIIALWSLTIAILLVGNRAWPKDTVFSEWLNIVVRAAWGLF